MARVLLALALAVAADAQTYGYGVGKSTWAANDPVQCYDFFDRFVPVVDSSGNCDNHECVVDGQVCNTQARVNLNDQKDFGLHVVNCTCHPSGSLGLEVRKTNGELGKCCRRLVLFHRRFNHAPTTRLTNQAFPRFVGAPTTCARRTKRARSPPGGTRRRTRFSRGSACFFGALCQDVERNVGAGLGNDWGSFAPIMDFNAGLWTHDLDALAASLTAADHPFVTLRWSGPSSGFAAAASEEEAAASSDYYSIVVRACGLVVLEVASERAHERARGTLVSWGRASERRSERWSERERAAHAQAPEKCEGTKRSEKESERAAHAQAG